MLTWQTDADLGGIRDALPPARREARDERPGGAAAPRPPLVLPEDVASSAIAAVRSELEARRERWAFDDEDMSFYVNQRGGSLDLLLQTRRRRL